MQLKAQITDATVSEKSGEKNGKPWSIKEQFAFVEINGERRRIVVPLPRNTAPLVSGIYTVDLIAHLRVGKFGGLELDDRITLIPFKA